MKQIPKFLRGWLCDQSSHTDQSEFIDTISIYIVCIRVMREFSALKENQNPHPVTNLEKSEDYQLSVRYRVTFYFAPHTASFELGANKAQVSTVRSPLTFLSIVDTKLRGYVQMFHLLVKLVESCYLLLTT